MLRTPVFCKENEPKAVLQRLQGFYSTQAESYYSKSCDFSHNESLTTKSENRVRESSHIDMSQNVSKQKKKKICHKDVHS